MSSEPECITLATVGNGSAVEKFDNALKVVLKNIFDVNTDPKVAREITVKIVFTPDEERERIGIVVSETVKLAPSKAHGSLAYCGVLNGQPVAVAYNPKQQKLFDDADAGPRPIRNFNAEEESK